MELDTAKNTHQIKKKFEIKVVRHRISYKEVYEGICLSIPGVEPGGLNGSHLWNIIMYKNGKVDLPLNAAEVKIGGGAGKLTRQWQRPKTKKNWRWWRNFSVAHTSHIFLILFIFLVLFIKKIHHFSHKSGIQCIKSKRCANFSSTSGKVVIQIKYDYYINWKNVQIGKIFYNFR